MFRRLSLTVSLLTASCFTYAGSSAISPGSSLTTGAAGNPMSVYGAHVNPALGDLVVPPDENWRINYFPSVTASAEVGPVDNFADDVDELIDLLDNPTLNEEPVEVTLGRLNETLDAIGEDGYTKLDALVYAPLLPAHWRPKGWLNGTISADLSLTTQARLSVLNDEVKYDDQNASFTTGSAAYMKTGLQTALSLGYSRPLFDAEEGEPQLYVGARVNLYQIDLSKQVYLLQLMEGRDIEELMRDEYDRNVESSTGVGLDLGVYWQSGRYSAGLTLANINEPSFEFGAVGANCNMLPAATDERSNCEAAEAFTEAGAIKGREVHTKHAVATVENSFALRNNWLVTAAVDLAEYSDMVGDQHQWASVATAYYPEGWLPDMRFGFRRNLAGEELSTVTAGLGFGNFTLDVEWGLDEVTIDDQNMPRRFSFALGFEERF